MLSNISNAATCNSSPSTSGSSFSFQKAISNTKNNKVLSDISNHPATFSNSPLLFSQIQPESSQDSFIPGDVLNRAEDATGKLLLYKSKPKYIAAYNNFMAWREKKGVKSLAQSVFLAYFDDLSESYAPNTCWSLYSMLRSVVQEMHNINIHDYGQIVQFLSNNGKGYHPRKANVLEPEHVQKFLKDAPDDKYLAVKVALIFGLQGGCRKHELCDSTIDNVQDKRDLVVVTIPDTKICKPKKFDVFSEFHNVYKKYANLRSEDTKCRRFFVCYRSGACKKQPIGINTIGAMRKVAATFLNLEKPESYTGHTFRRTSTTILADAGATREDMKRHGGWKSDQVAEGYIEESMCNKRKIGKMIADSMLGPAEKRTACDQPASATKENISTATSQEKIQSMPSTAVKTINWQLTYCNNITLVLENNKGTENQLI